MRLCVFNPEHDLCLAKGRWNYVPPRSVVDFARRDADIMQVLYPDAVCCSVYDYPLATMHSPLHEVVAWATSSLPGATCTFALPERISRPSRRSVYFTVRLAALPL